MRRYSRKWIKDQFDKQIKFTIRKFGLLQGIIDKDGYELPGHAFKAFYKAQDAIIYTDPDALCSEAKALRLQYHFLSAFETNLLVGDIMMLPPLMWEDVKKKRLNEAA